MDELVPIPLINPKRNLIFHCYAVRENETLFHWHAQELKRRINLFNGRRIVAVVSDEKTLPEVEVRAAFGEGFEFLSFWNNEKQGESLTFPVLLELVMSSDPSEITFYAHTKGMSYLPGKKRLGTKPWHDPELIRHWSSQMYRANLDRVDLIEQALTAHGVAGSFRRHQRLGEECEWYFSGSFFWLRHVHVDFRRWRAMNGGRLASEAWPGKHFALSEAACLSGEGVGSLYKPEAWARLDRELEKFLSSPEARPPELVPGPELTLITPTGLRPDAFRLCEEWIRRQTYSKPYQWIVVDDGQIPTHTTLGQTYIRRQPREAHTLPDNLRAAIPHVRGEKILFIEDDEWYHPEYLEKMAGWLQDADKVGAGFARYYWPRLARYREFPAHQHASLCRTGIRRSLLGDLAAACRVDDPSVDLRLWQKPGQRHDLELLVVGMKQMPGRKSGGGDPASGQADPDLKVLRKWIGEDARHYELFLPKPILPRELTVFTVVLGGYDRIRPPKVTRPGVRYVAITDGEAPGWEVIRPPTMRSPSVFHESRRLKILGPELFFPEAELVFYLDGQLVMGCDPWALVAECEAWGEADLYLFRHQERECIYDEAQAVVDVRKEHRRVAFPQIERYRAEGFPKRAGLYLGGIHLRRPGAKGFSRLWWQEVERGSHRDQLSLPVALSRSGVSFQALPAMWWDNFLPRQNHAKHRPLR